MKQGSSEVCTGELTGNLVEQASATTGVYREREVRLHAWIFSNILSSLLPFLPPPSPLPHCGISLFSNVPISLFTGDFASHPQPWDFFFSSSFIKAVLKVLFGIPVPKDSFD